MLNVISEMVWDDVFSLGMGVVVGVEGEAESNSVTSVSLDFWCPFELAF